MRILAIDPGERRVGLALSDALGVTAQGLETFDRAGGADLVDHIAALVSSHNVTEIVVGKPLRATGGASSAGRKAQILAEKLQARLGVPVTMWDERFSTAEAERVLRGTKARKKKSLVDRLAAVIILQSYLEYRRNAHEP